MTGRETLFESFEKTPDGCWVWTSQRRGRYGRYGHKTAHRVIYERLVGPIPPGLELDHLCRNTFCVNPEHLEPVTKAENMRRVAAANTACRAGHEYTPETTYIDPSGSRFCRTCTNANSRRYQARKRAEKRAAK